MSVSYTFSSISDLWRWLQRKADECSDPEAYDEWLQTFFDGGNTITVHGEEYDYWSCWELL